MTSDTKKFLLTDSDLPRAWYNLLADLPAPPPPPLHPGTLQPIGPADLAPLFPMALIQQEVSREREIEIPERVREAYRIYRPSPLVRARNLEKALDTPAHLYFKYEGVSPTGSHKPNTAIPQAYFNALEGTRRLTTETGAGQWGSSLAFAAQMFGLEVEVFMVRVSYDQKPYRRALMETFGASCTPSPSPRTAFGRSVLEREPNSPGSLGIAISEAVEAVSQKPHSRYALGSVLNHVLMHQTVVGLEAMRQFELAGEEPDVLIGCAGGGSNFGGFVFPFVGKHLRGGRKYRVIAVEPAACPSLTRGAYAYDFGDAGRMTPLVKMHTLGSGFIPPSLHAGGLRYHGMSPLVSHLKELGLVEAVAYDQKPCFEAAVQLARTEGIVAAPESSHAVRAAIDAALECKRTGKKQVIAFNLSGHGHFDMQAYVDYFAGKLGESALDTRQLELSLQGLPKVA